MSTISSGKNRLLRRGVRTLFSKTFSDNTPSHSKEYFETDIEQPISPGWNLVKAIGTYDADEASILLDLGFGYEEANRFHLNCLNGILSSSVVKAPQGIRNIRLALKRKKTAGMQEVILNFIPIFKIDAFYRIAFYLYKLNKLRGISAVRIFQEKWHQIRKNGALHIIKNLGQFYDYGNSGRPLGYQQWIRRNEFLDDDTRHHILNRSFDFSPLCSIVCELDGCIDTLARTVDSLQRQVYLKWRLIVVIDKGSSSETIARIKKNLSDDERISILESVNPESSNLVAATLSQMDGEFGLWMVAGDRLSTLALYYWVEAMNIRPETVVWYCDSDQLDHDGERHTPCFRPSWNKELFYSQDYIGNGCFFHLPTIRQCCNPEELTKHAEKYDLLLHFLERLPEGRIGHVAKALYHHNHIDLSPDKSKYESDQQRIALARHFQQLGEEVPVKPGLLPYTHRLLYPLPDVLPRVTLIIPTRDQVKILKNCIESIIQKTEYPEYNIIVVNNGSTEPATLAYFKRIQKAYKIKIVDYNKPFNYAAINNFGVKKTDAELIGMLNNDIEVISSKWLHEMARYAIRQKIGCVGAKLLYGNGSIQHAGVICGLGSVAGHAHRYLPRDDSGYFGRLQSAQYYSAVTAACLLVRRKVYLEMGGLNERLTVAYNDVDFCLRVKKAGYKNVYTPYAELYHHESLSRGPEDTSEKRERYQEEVDYMWKTWKNELENDECYNPNLSRLREDFSL